MKITTKTNFNQVSAELGRLAAKSADATPLYRSIGSALRSLVDLQFRSSQDPYGRPWAKLKSRKGQILVDSGRGRAGFTFDAGPKSVELGNVIQYMAYHQDGYTVRKAKDRFQPTNSRGRFISRTAAGRRRKVTLVRRITAAQPFTVPARKMLPETEPLPAKWQGTIGAELRVYLSNLAKGV